MKSKGPYKRRESMDTEQRSRMRVLMLPWLAQGHITPFLELAKKLANRNFHIYLCSTPINLSSIKNRITDQKHSLSIELVDLHLPSLPNLPPHNHTTNGLPHHLMPTLNSALEMAIPNFTTILETLTPDLVIYDYNPPWAPTIAAAHNIPAVVFMTTGAAIVSFGVHGARKRGIEFPFQGIQLRGFHETKFRRMLDDARKETKGDEVNDRDAMGKSRQIILFNTFREFEGKYIDYLSILLEKKIVPVGPLVQEIVGETKETEIMNWLDEKDDSSTVFVSFGSEYYLSKEEIMEVAHGLELSRVNFIWVVRFPVGERVEVEVEEALPEGFVGRVKERGLVVEGWAPQAQILAHSSTGGFVSHCGWNSILESVTSGVPIVAMPMHLDQPANARLVEEVGVGVEVEREEDGRLNREEIAQVIRKVVVEKSGEGIRIKAREFSESIRLKGEEGFDEVVEELMKICKERK